VAVASAGLYASLHLAPDRKLRQHSITQIFTGRMPFLPPNQQSQSTEGNKQKQQETTHILQIHTTVFSQWKVPGPMWQHFRHNVQNVGFY